MDTRARWLEKQMGGKRAPAHQSPSTAPNPEREVLMNSINDTELQTEQVQRTCAVCRRMFSTTAYLLLCRTLAASICPTCDERRQQAQREAEEHAHKQRVQIESERREAAWAKLCPVEFRLPREAGGQTELARMDRERPAWRRVLEWRYGPRGLIVRGETGHLKTRATWRLLRRLWDEGRTIRALTAARFDRECRDAGGTFTLSAWFDQLGSVDALFLDDLGKARWTPATEAQFFDLVDQRTREGKPLVYTTNDNGDSLAARLSADCAEPLIRRLRDFSEQIVL